MQPEINLMIQFHRRKPLRIALLPVLVCSIFSLIESIPVRAEGTVDNRTVETDVIPTPDGDIVISFPGHGSLMLSLGGLIVHVDPWSRVTDYSTLPAADLLLITHNHADHLDPDALAHAVDEQTDIVCPKSCEKDLPGCIVVSYGDLITVQGLPVEVVPSYNLTNMKNPGGRLVHPKGLCNGYIVTFGGKRIYFAGETENVPELSDVKNIDICFFAMDGVYNMTPEMAVGAVKVIRPKVLYPIHYGDADVSVLEHLLEGTGTEVRIRNMQ